MHPCTICPVSTPDLSRVILSWPKNLADKPKDGSRRSWNQLVRTGQFHSNRYGKFSITKADLSQMLANFKDVTPQAPTELPIDYDHLSMDPKKPGDGIAAGWMKQLELREDGDELWAEIEWTETGADRVERKEYRFVSPSFVKDHKHKDGRKIGTTLLAAAITNHPFLEGMQALSLYNCSTVNELFHGRDIKPEQVAVSAHEVFLMSEVGQRAMIAPGHARTMDETGGTFEIVEVVGQGDDAFVVLKDANGVLHKWFRSTELLPASATPMPVAPNLVPGTPNALLPPDPGAPAHPEVAAQVEAAAAEAGAKAAALGASPEEQAAAMEAARAEATALSAQADPTADGATPAAAMADGTDPAASAAAATAVAEGDGTKTPDVKAAEEVKGNKKAVDGSEETSENGAPDETDPLKKAVGALLGAKAPVKKVTNMSKFMLRNDKNEEIPVSEEQLAAAGIRIVKDGETVIGTKELGDLNGKVTNLSSQVETLANATVVSQKKASSIELKAELDRLSTGGYILKTNRDYAEKKWGESTDLADFKEWAGQFTTVIVQLNKEHGSGRDNDEPEGKEAANQLITLANTISREKGINLRDAMIQASVQMPSAAEAYREQFSNAN